MKRHLVLCAAVGAAVFAFGGRPGPFDDAFFAVGASAPSGPVEAAWFKCDDSAADTVVADASANAQNASNGVPTTASRSVSGKIGGALTYLGSEFAIASGSAVAATLSGDSFTIAFWAMRSDSWAHAEWFLVLGHPGTMTYYNTDYSVLLFYYFIGEGGSVVTSVFEFPQNTWCHFAFVKSGSFMGLYVNGVLCDQPADDAVSHAATGLMFGGAGTYYEQTRTLDDLRVFRTGLTPGEVAALYNNGAGLDVPLSKVVD